MQGGKSYRLEKLVLAIQLADVLKGDKSLSKTIKHVSALLGMQSDFMAAAPVSSVITIRRARFLVDAVRALLVKQHVRQMPGILSRAFSYFSL